MSEASRQRWLTVNNRLEELLVKLGPPAEDEQPIAPDHHPSWGPVGSLAKREMGEREFAQLMALDQAMLEQERARVSRGSAPEPAEPKVTDW
jgi:hypothetical protein